MSYIYFIRKILANTGMKTYAGLATTFLALSKDRIASVRVALVTAGVLESMIVDETAFGQENSVLQYKRNPVDAWSRRVDISVLPKRFTPDQREHSAFLSCSAKQRQLYIR